MELSLAKLERDLNWELQKEEKRKKENAEVLRKLEESRRSSATIQLEEVEDSPKREGGIPYTALGDEGSLTPNQLMRLYKSVPSYGVTIKYFADVLGLFFEDDEYAKLVDDIKMGLVTKSKPTGAKGKENPSEKHLDKLVNAVNKKFEQNGVPKKGEKNYGLPYIRKNILDMKEDEFLTVFAPALGFKYEDIEAYLLRVFRRVGLNVSDYREFMLYIAIQNRNEEMSTYKVFVELCKYYENLKEAVAFEGTEEIDDTYLFLTKCGLASIDEKQEKIFQGESCTEESIHPLLREILVKHCKSTLNDYRPAQSETFQKLKKEVLLMFADEVYDYQMDKNGTGRYKTISVDIVGCQEEKILEPVTETPGYIKRPKRSKEKETTGDKGDKTSWNLVSKISGRLIKKNEESPILIHTDISYDGEKGTLGKAKGKLQLKCSLDTYIPEGTIFSCYDEQKRKTFLYETIKEACAVPLDTFCNYLYRAKDEWIPMGDSEDDIEEIEACKNAIDAALFGEWLDKAEITNQRAGKFDKKTTEERRNYILTLLFLKFAKKQRDSVEMTRSQVRDKFMKKANPVLKKCGFAKIHSLNPFDLLLLYVLGMNDAVGAFREIWVYYAAAKEK